MEAGLIRRLRARVRRAEIALAQTPNDAARTAIASARDAMALFCEHTWGLDVKTFLGAIPDYRRAAFDAFRKSEACLRMEESWREQSARALRAKAYCEQAEKALGIPVETERPRECGAPCADTALENDAYRLEFDPTTGVVLSLYDKRRGCALLSARGRRSAIEYVYQRYGMADINEYLRAYAYHFTDWGVLDNGRERYPDCERLTRLPAFEGCERAGDTVIFSYRGAPDDDLGDARRIELSLSLAQGDAPLCVRARLLGKRATPYVESAELCFSLPEQPTRYLLNKPGCVVDPARDIAPCANHAFYALERFAACDGARALTVVETEDCALMSIGESGVYQFRREYAPSEPVLRFCLLNNMWGTNFPQWIAGDFAFDFRVSARDAGDIDGAMRASAPKVTLPFALPSDWEVVHIAPARGGLTVCLHALSARPTRGELRFPGYRLRLTDLAGRALGAWQTEALAISAGAYGLCAVRAERLSAAGSVTL